ncbi:MAG: hypothetical protein CHH17_07725 [Candidatus Fluviicola riflensis]|nr:MAG: hypothetical protein CHH17_07725 [Candidatus Fluviicola riflensis]
MTSMFLKYAVAVCLLITVPSFAQQLKRVANKGISVEKLTEARQKELGITETRGVYIKKIIPGFTAEALNVKEKDILIRINNTAIESVDDVLQPSLKLREGDDVSFTVIREKKEKTLKGKAIANPKEDAGDLSIEYGSFPFMGGQISSIFLQPATPGKKPAILFIPGLNCMSLDNMWEEHVYRKLVYSLANKGYLVMRAEKPGMGDSYNTPACEDIDFPTEVNSFREALKALKKHPNVDTNNIIVIGHSMGAMEAPFVAEGNNVRGIVAMGLTVKPWLEYLTEMVRIQNPRLGIDYLQNERDLKLYETLLFELLVNKKNLADIVPQNPEYERILRRDMNYEGTESFLGRDLSFSQTLNDQDIAAAWAKTDCKVLSAWGETDIQVLGDFSHKEVVKLINTYHPGNATFLELTDTDHNFLLIPTMEESYQRNADGSLGSLFPTRFNEKMVEEFHQWIQSVIVK